jgi:ankyrin repeat protein
MSDSSPDSSSPVETAEEAAVAAVRAGDQVVLIELLAEHPELANASLATHGGRSLLHVATDWPGHLPNIAATVRALVGAGVDPNVRATGRHRETPLHWAASSDDTDAIDALLDAGADINAPGAVIGDGTPLADATAFGQWEAARRLVDRGAAVTLWEAAALGLLPAVRAHLESTRSTEDVTASFWGACHGGHRETAAYLLERGADLNWVGWDDLTPLDVAQRSKAGDLVDWLNSQGARSASQLP